MDGANEDHGSLPPQSEEAPKAVPLSDDDILQLIARQNGAFAPDATLSLPGRATGGDGFQRRDFSLGALRQTRQGIDDTARQSLAARAHGHGVGTESDQRERASSSAKTANAQFHASSPAMPIDVEAIKRAAREEGREDALLTIEDARKEAREEALRTATWEAEASVSEARDVFLAAAARLEQAADDAERRLAETITQTVHQIASDRAGQIIDSSGPAFIARIERLARTVAEDCSQAQLSLNPTDLAAIKPHLDDAPALASAHFTPDPALARGDLRLKLGDVEFEDVLAPTHEARRA